MKAKYINPFINKILNQAFEKAEIAKFGQAELDSYENSLKYYRDIKGAIDTAFDDGKIEGRIEGKIEIAKKLKVRGLSTEDIAEVTGLSEDEIEKL